MALIKTLEEAKAALPRALSNLSNQAVMPDFAASENKYLIPVIGNALYDAINDKLNHTPTPTALSTEETAVLPFMRRVSAAYAFYDEMGTDAAKITDSGVRRLESANMPSAYGWQFKELKATLAQRAADSIEILLNYLFNHTDDYADTWKLSEQYSRLKGMLIKSGTEFTGLYELFQPNRSFFAMAAIMDEVQEELISTSIGEDLVTYLAATLTEEEEKKIQKQVKKALAYYTIARACKQFPVRFDSNGFTVLNSGGDGDNPETAGRAPADVPMFRLKMEEAASQGEAFLKKAKKRAADYRADGGTHAAFNTAFDAGPLASFVDPATKTKGNETRKIFRL